ATLYYLLTVEVPAIAPLRAIGTPLERPKQINPSISDKVNQAIVRGMEVKPEDRPQSMREYLELLGMKVAETAQPYYQSPQQTFSVPLISAVGVDYTKLRDLLAAGNWIGANLETGNILLSIACSRKGRWLDSESIERIPCQDLCIIDELWVNYSNGRFGFSVQKRIWKSVNGNVNQFGKRVGWRVESSWIKYAQFTFNLNAPEGHLPEYLQVLGFVWKSGLFGAYWDGHLNRFYTFVSKLEECIIQ
ncbi:MAG: GUN4 domain-containing protein, partial [Cyanobacteriota bacterium]|nr:GUN4 domain-containing protein [Cyanobacteriota bacterium]